MMAASSTSSNSTTIRFNVCGNLYEVSRSLIELYPESMLARLISDEWNNTNEDEDKDPKEGTTSKITLELSGNNITVDADKNKTIFIDRNGHRFQYILDYMRDHEINLPMTESIEAIKKELEYYGLMKYDHTGTDDENEENSTNKQPRINLGTPIEAARVIATIDSNIGQELDAFVVEIRTYQKKIDECEHKAKAVKVARNLFQRSVVSFEKEIEKNEKFTIHLVQEEEVKDAYHASINVLEFLEERLATYGLLLVSHRTNYFGGKTCFTLKSSGKNM